MLLPFLLTSFLLRTTQPRDSTNTTCAPIHIIIARASTEPQGPGIIGTLAALIKRDNPGTTQESIVYPATLTEYAASSTIGTEAMIAQLTRYVDKCPESKMVLLGYSQGAQVVLDGLCGGGGYPGLGSVTPAIDRRIGDHVTAVIQVGDPRHIVDQSYDRGTGSVDGIYPRQAYQLCDYYADRIQVYCDQGDPFCDSGAILTQHLDYILKYNDVALQFVDQKLKEYIWDWERD